ncbi:hypothetical protein C4573_05105 [Candidatus Woesearchaeota archaeon]|nr:MAG: hypothetical protein C4573_05105 [Candidatus Woesearchaeota archaeon]
MYQATLTVDFPLHDLKNIEQLFKTEEPMNNERGSFSFSLKKTLTFTITAKDAVALRATMNMIMKTLAVYEDIAKRKNGQRNPRKN